MSNVIKTELEIENMRKACAISSGLHLLAMSSPCAGLTENKLAKKINNSYQASDATSWAYPIIIGSGERGLILHAEPTSRILKDGDLVLIDGGVKYQGIASDITRTWPVGLKFSKEQRTIYKIVLKAQKEVIKRVKPNEDLLHLHQICQDYLLEGLLSANLIKGKNIKRFFPHKTSHWIGQHVHDRCAYFYEDKTPVKLSAGMCFTVEPGLYLKNKSIGIRIEDVILVTETGYEVLSHVPKELDEVEEIRSWSVR